MNKHPNQEAFTIDELTDPVKETVLREFEAIAGRGDVLGGMETGCRRSRIQKKSLY